MTNARLPMYALNGGSVGKMYSLIGFGSICFWYCGCSCGCFRFWSFGVGSVMTGTGTTISSSSSSDSSSEEQCSAQLFMLSFCSRSRSRSHLHSHSGTTISNRRGGGVRGEWRVVINNRNDCRECFHPRWCCGELPGIARDDELQTLYVWESKLPVFRGTVVPRVTVQWVVNTIH